MKSRFARNINRQRALCEDPEIIHPYFTELERIKVEYGILDEDIYNFDEIGFAIGLIATTKVISRAEMRGKPWLIQPGNREWVTTIECINSMGLSVRQPSFSKKSAILRDGLMNYLSHLHGELRSVIIGGLQMQLAFTGLKNALYQLYKHGEEGYTYS